MLKGLSFVIITDVSVAFLATVALKPFCVCGLGLSKYLLDAPANLFNADFCLLPAINLDPCTDAFNCLCYRKRQLFSVHISPLNCLW
tara:strand:+ start:266 stop:526 length:261 start_codon:yes stop_codon:yes gene_type:complete